MGDKVAKGDEVLDVETDKISSGVECAFVGTLRRQGFAVSAFLVGLDETARLEAHGRLLAETVRDIRYVNTEQELAALAANTAVAAPSSYAVDIPLL